MNTAVSSEPLAVTSKPVKKARDPRMGLRTSATLATVFTLLGHTVFGFEQSWAQLVVALVTGYSCALFFEWVDAGANGRPPGYAGGGFKKTVDFLLSAHMTSITLSFLIYVNERLWIMAFAVALGIGSKYVLRVRQNGRYRHFMNPSNFAIAFVLGVYQWTGMLPWSYTVNIGSPADWILPLVIVGLGMRLNLLFTGRIPTILSWLVTFVVLAAARSWIFHIGLPGQLVVLTGIPMVLFTFYMITDPQTSPSPLRSQILYGSGIATAYSVLLIAHVQYTMFYSVTAICSIRGLWLVTQSLRERAVSEARMELTAARA